MLFAIFLKSKTFFFSNWNPKIMVQFCYFLRPIFRHCTINCNCFLSSVAKDGKNGHGLKLEKSGSFFQVLMLFLQKLLKKYYDWCYLVKFDLCFLFNPMGAFLNYYVDFWLCNPHVQMVMELYWCRLPANRGAANQNKIVFILPTHWFSHKVNYLKYKLPANNRVGLGSGKMWHGDILFTLLL